MNVLKLLSLIKLLKKIVIMQMIYSQFIAKNKNNCLILILIVILKIKKYLLKNS